MGRLPIAFAVTTLFGLLTLDAVAEQIYRSDHVVVRYDGIDAAYARAIADAVDGARSVAVASFGCDMPETVHVTVTADPKGRTRLFNDGQDRLSLTVESQRDLHKPEVSGIFTIYGFCHEIGHLAMYRPIRDHGWMTSHGAEGWAHYMGSRLVDELWSAKGERLWPDPHNYLAHGAQRLETQLSGEKPSPAAQAAAIWKQLHQIVGDKGVAPVFKSWGQADVDPADPGAALRKALLAANPDDRLADWWNKAEPALVFVRPASDVSARTISRADLEAKGVDLSHDDGTAVGKKSIAGSGHAIRFEAPGGDWYLTSLRVHGSRYGYPAPPKENFHVWLCDEDLKVIADFAMPYAKFRRAEPRWVPLRVEPTNVPARFVVCLGFNPTGTKGVYVSYDSDNSGNSLYALPGQEGDPAEGDWLVRVKLQQAKGTDPLKLPE